MTIAALVSFKGNFDIFGHLVGSPDTSTYVIWSEALLPPIPTIKTTSFEGIKVVVK